MNNTIQATFKFSIGELVYLRSDLHALGHTPKGHIVVQRLLLDGPHGRAVFYRLDDIDRQVSEVALSTDPPPYQQRHPARRAEELMRLNEDRRDADDLYHMIEKYICDEPLPDGGEKGGAN